MIKINSFRFYILTTLIVFLVSCSITDRKHTENLIIDFREQNKIDAREVIFDIVTSFQKGKLVLQGETDNEELKNKLINTLGTTAYVDNITILPDSSIKDKKFALIKVSVSNLRKEPANKAELVSQALMGTPVKLLKKTGSWYLIKTPDTYISWIYSDEIVPVSESEYQTWRNSQRVIFTDDYSTIYDSETLIKPISDVVCGNIFEVTEQNFRLIKLRFPDGRFGYSIKKGWITLSDYMLIVPRSADSILILAKKFMGRPYLWGGTSSLAMDCSGFTKTVFFMNGIILPRDASQQAYIGETITPNNYFDNVRAGDLLFFGKKAENGGKDRVTHVGISLGQTNYIHESGIVQINSFDPQSPDYSDARRKSFLWATRILGIPEMDKLLVKNHSWY